MRNSSNKSIFGSAVCTLACGSIVRSLRSFFASPSFRRGWVAPPLHQVALKMKNNAVCSRVTAEIFSGEGQLE